MGNLGSELTRGISNKLDETVLRCMEPNAEDRYESAAALRAALESAARRRRPAMALAAVAVALGAWLVMGRGPGAGLRAAERPEATVERVQDVAPGLVAGREAPEPGPLPSEQETGLAAAAARQALARAKSAAEPARGEAESARLGIGADERQFAAEEVTAADRTFAGIEMVWIPPGSFTMGSPSSEAHRESDETQHQVTLTKGFWMGKYEVTQVQWQAVMGTRPWERVALGLRVRKTKGDVPKGAVVEGIEPDSAAQSAGFEIGDIVVSVDSEKIEDQMGLLRKISGLPAGSRIRVDFLRNGEPREKTVLLKVIDLGGGLPDSPVGCLSWDDCREFVRKLNAQGEGLPAGSVAGTFRLPTEVEWEYACRAGSTTAYSFGESESQLESYAWYSSNSGSSTHPVGQKKANAWGLYDMHGSVWEWCQDWYVEDYYQSSPSTDPTGPSDGAYRVLRGGSWSDSPWSCRSANRLRYNPTVTRHNGGFRVVCVPR